MMSNHVQYAAVLLYYLCSSQDNHFFASPAEARH